MKSSPYILPKPIRILYILLVSITPLVFLPITQNFYDTAKFYYLAFLSIITIFGWLFIGVWKREITVRLSQFLIPLGMLAIAVALSIITSSPNKIEALLYPFGIVTLVSLFLMMMLNATFLTIQDIKILRISIITVMTFAGLLSIYQFLGLGKLLFSQISYISDVSWTPLGSKPELLTMLLFVLPLLYQFSNEAFQQKKSLSIGISTIMALILLSASTITVFQYVRDWQATTLPFSAAWSIMLETFKNPRYIMTGVGVDNFVYAYTLGKPAWLNTTPFSNLRFILSSNTILHLMTSLGALGCIASFFIIQSLFSLTQKHRMVPLSITLIIAFFLLPPNLLFFFVLALLILLTSRYDDIHVIRIHPSIFISYIGFTIIICVLLIGAVSLLAQTYSAEAVFYSSQNPKYLTDGIQIYNLQLTATKKNPFIARYHAALSQTSLQLANAIIKRASERNEDKKLNDTEKQTVIQLINLSTQESRITTQLAPLNVTAWENLASIYQNIINVAESADQMAINATSQAIALDPTNPYLRVSLASSLIQKKQYDNALQQLILATQLKPDYANAYYNLAHLFELKGDLANRKTLLEKTLSLVATDSADFTKATLELDFLNEQLEASLSGRNLPQATPFPTPKMGKTATTSSVLTTPPPISPLLPTPLELKE